jgi:hypothetical protein
MTRCMSSILALSVSDKVDQYGAYAGFASVLGLAILSLLYFAQAREVKRLREWAGRAPERAADVQDRAVAAAQQRVIAQPQRPGQPAPAVPPVPGARPAAATPAGQAAGAAVPAAAAATAAGAATATPPGQQTSVQPAANGAAQSPPDARPGEPLRVPPAAAGAGAPGGVPPGATRTNYGPDDRDDEGRSRWAVGGAIAAVVVVLIIIVVLVTGVLGGGSDDNGTQPSSTVAGSASSSTRSSTRTARTRTPAAPSATPKPGTYEVAVLNGTTVLGLARGVANRLQNTRFKIGTVTNAATQDRSATLVEFAPGHRAEADAVAKAIDVGSDSIQQLSPASKTIAGDSATVVVTVGSDQNQTPAAPTGTTTTQ